MSGVRFGIWDLAAALYVAGVVWGLFVIDAKPTTKIVLALAWPVGPMAFAVTLTILLAAALIAFPVLGLIALVVAAAWLFVM